jgi:hypothetical protein
VRLPCVGLHFRGTVAVAASRAVGGLLEMIRAGTESGRLPNAGDFTAELGVCRRMRSTACPCVPLTQGRQRNAPQRRLPDADHPQVGWSSLCSGQPPSSAATSTSAPLYAPLRPTAPAPFVSRVASPRIGVTKAPSFVHEAKRRFGAVPEVPTSAVFQSRYRGDAKSRSVSFLPTSPTVVRGRRGCSRC